MRTTPSRHRWTRRALAAGALGVAALLTLSACSNDTSGGDSEDANAITVYNAQHESLTQEWVDEFTAETGLTVNLRNGSDSEMANQLIAEGVATGGMQAKLNAATDAIRGGIGEVVIAPGALERAAARIVAGDSIGTRLVPQEAQHA